MAEETPEALEFLLNCQICLEPFDPKVRIPRILPCHHTFCGPCIAKLDRGGVLTCPNDRREIDVTGPFPVDFTRGALVDYKDVLLRKGGPSSPLEETCQKHQDEKLKFFCTTCNSALCSECAVIEHKNKVGHDIVRLGDVLEQVKREIEARSKELDAIRELRFQPRAKMAATSLQETNASFNTAEQEIEYVFSQAVNALLDRKAQAMEELRSRWKVDRMELEDQAMVTQSLVSSAKTCTALGRTVSSVGLPSHIVAQNEELERAVQEARAEGGKPLQPSTRYKVNTDLSGLLYFVQELGTFHSVRSQSREQKTAKQQAKQTVSVTSRITDIPTTPLVTSSSVIAVTSRITDVPTTPLVTSSSFIAETSWSTDVPITSSVTSATILTPEFQLEPGRCGAGCTLLPNGRTLTNTPCRQSVGTRLSGPRPFAFLGTCGSVDLTQPALYYWTVTRDVRGGRSGNICEFGLASLQTLDTCGEGQRISDHDVASATLVVVRDGYRVRLEGRNWTKDVEMPQPPHDCDVTYTCLLESRLQLEMSLGFLYDNRQPQSPCVLAVEEKSCRLLGARRLPPSPPLVPVLRVWPGRTMLGRHDALLEVRTGPGILSDFTARQLLSLSQRMITQTKE